jgi:hypothetical protein
MNFSRGVLYSLAFLLGDGYGSSIDILIEAASRLGLRYCIVN